jgi:hypothetical protein
MKVAWSGVLIGTLRHAYPSHLNFFAFRLDTRRGKDIVPDGRILPKPRESIGKSSNYDLQMFWVSYQRSSRIAGLDTTIVYMVGQSPPRLID